MTVVRALSVVIWAIQRQQQEDCEVEQLPPPSIPSPFLPSSWHLGVLLYLTATGVPQSCSSSEKSRCLYLLRDSWPLSCLGCEMEWNLARRRCGIPHPSPQHFLRVRCPEGVVVLLFFGLVLCFSPFWMCLDRTVSSGCAVP